VIHQVIQPNLDHPSVIPARHAFSLPIAFKSSYWMPQRSQRVHVYLATALPCNTFLHPRNYVQYSSIVNGHQSATIDTIELGGRKKSMSLCLNVLMAANRHHLPEIICQNQLMTPQLP
jgi:hypothetical protein